MLNKETWLVEPLIRADPDLFPIAGHHFHIGDQHSGSSGDGQVLCPPPSEGWRRFWTPARGESQAAQRHHRQHHGQSGIHWWQWYSGEWKNNTSTCLQFRKEIRKSLVVKAEEYIWILCFKGFPISLLFIPPSSSRSWGLVQLQDV